MFCIESKLLPQLWEVLIFLVMRILLVEDDLRLASLVAEALSDYGYVVDTAADGELGWDQSRREDYGVILLDVDAI